MSTRSRRRWLATVLFALTLTGCSDRPAAGPQPSAAPAPSLTAPSSDVPPSSTPAPTTTRTPTSRPTATATATPRPGGDLVSVTRSGGFAGITETVTVRANGAWTRTNRRAAERTGRLSDTQLSQVRALAADPRLARESRTGGGTSGACADTFSYAVVTADQRIRYEDCPGRVRPAATLALVTYVLDATKP